VRGSAEISEGMKLAFQPFLRFYTPPQPPPPLPESLPAPSFNPS